MYSNNVSSDWDQYWLTCPDCDSRFHASEFCECENEEEDEEDDVEIEDEKVAIIWCNFKEQMRINK